MNNTTTLDGHVTAQRLHDQGDFKAWQILHKRSYDALEARNDQLKSQLLVAWFWAFSATVTCIVLTWLITKHL